MSFFERVKDATIGFSGYPRLMRDRQGAFGYFAALLAIVVAINGYINLVQLRSLSAELSHQLAGAADFGVRNGAFYYEGSMPAQWETPDGRTLVIDTTGATTPEAFTGKSGILITRQRYYLFQQGVLLRDLDFSLLQNDFTKADFEAFLKAPPERVLSLIYLVIYLGQMAFKAVDASILAAIALRYAHRAGQPFSFGTGFNLALYAMTLPTIVQWVWQDFHTYTMFGFAVWWTLATTYLLGGLRAYLADTPRPGQVDSHG